MSTKQPSKSVFVGNIPYGLTEEQIVRIFSSAGKVLNFRLVYDRETGRPKGFGFVEFPDADSASSAVRNLNDYEIMNRKLRVDFSNDGGDDDSNSHAQPQTLPYSTQLPLSMALPPSNGLPPPPPPPSNTSFPNLPTGVDLPPNLSCPDAISRTLNTLPPQQLLDVLSQMKTLATTDAAKATELLQQAPQLSYAIFQALLLMGLVSTEALGSVVEAASAPQPQVIRQPQYSAPPPPQQTYNPAPPGYGPPPGQPQYQPPAPVAPPPPPQQLGGQDTDALMAQVLAMPQELIDSLPPAERAQLLALRASFGR